MGKYFELCDSQLPVPSLTKLTAAFLAAVVGCLCFHSSLHGDFVFDDREAIVENKDVIGASPLYDVFIHDFWGSSLKSKTSHKSYRPLTVLTFRLNYILTGRLDPLGFHLINIILHGINCILVFWTYSVILCDADCFSLELKTEYASKGCFLGSLLFAVHPIHSECVAGIVGRADLLSCLFFLLAFIAYTRSLKAGTTEHSGSEMMYFIVTVALSSLAIFSKEQGATVLGVCAIYDVVKTYEYIGGNIFSGISSFYDANDNYSKKKVKKMLLRVTMLILSALALVGLRLYIMDFATPKFQPVDNPAAFDGSLITRVLSFNYIYSINFWILLSPWWLCFDWSMGCIPLLTVGDWRVLVPLCLWVVLSLLVIRALVFFKTKDFVSRNIVMALTFLVVPFLPASNLFFTVGFVVAERVLYIPSIGFSLLVVLGITAVVSRQPSKLAKASCLLLLVLHMTRSIQRSYDWLSEEALFTNGERVCPLNAKVQYNIGKILADKGKEEQAIAYYHEAIRLHPNYDQALNNLGNLIKGAGKSEEAELYLERAVKASPRFAAGWMNLGIVKADLNKHREAEKCYLNAIEFRKQYPDAHFNLGNLYLATHRQEEALRQFDHTLALKPAHSSAWINKMLLLDNIGRMDDAIKAGEIAVRYLPDDAAVSYNIGNLLGKAGKYEESELYLLRAIEKNPYESSYHGNLGVLYHRWRRYKAAERYYQRSLELNPQNHFSQENYQKLKRVLGKL